MQYVTPRSILVVFFSLAASAFSQEHSRSDGMVSLSTEEASVRKIMDKLFTAIAAKDLQAALALWNGKSADLAAFEKRLQQQFAQSDYRLTTPSLYKLEVREDRAIVRVSILARSTTRTDKGSREEQWISNVELIRSGTEWKLRRYSDAIEDLARALAEAESTAARDELLARENDLLMPDVVVALLRIGNGYTSTGQHSLATTAFQSALTCAQRLQDRNGRARALASLANLEVQQGRYSEAMDRLRESLSIFESIKETGQAIKTLRSIGQLHYRKGDYASALDYFEKALSVSTAEGDRRGISACLNDIGMVYSRRGDHVKAEENYRRSFALNEELGDRENVGISLVNIGIIKNAQGDYTQALQYCRKSLQIFEELELQSRIAGVVLTIGDIHANQGDHEQALSHFRRSLNTFEKRANLNGSARTLLMIGYSNTQQGEYHQALPALQRSVQIFEKLQDQDGIARAYYNIGLALSKQGAHTSALGYFEKCMELANALGDQTKLALALRNIAHIHERAGRYKTALEFAERAAALVRENGRIDTLWRARLTAGHAHRALGHREEARQAFEEAIANVEILRQQGAGEPRQQQLLFESRVAPYHGMLELLLAEKDIGGALTVAERSKSRVLVDTLAAGGVKVTKNMSEREREQEKRLNDRLASLNAAVIQESGARNPDPGRLAELRSRLQEARLDLEAFRITLYAAYPELRLQRGQVQTLDIGNAVELLPDSTTALLEFVVTEDRAYLFVLTNHTGAHVYQLEITPKNLTNQVERFRVMLGSADARFSKTARELYDLLLGPATAQLDGKTRLVVVPDGPVWELPMQSLIKESGRYVIDDHEVFYSPSLTVLREALRARNRRRDPAAATVLAFGNPAIGRETADRVTPVLLDGRLDPLPEAEQQVRMLQKIYGPARSKAFVGRQASEERFKREAGDYRILHLATHGILNDRNPMYSYLVLAQTGNSDQEDGALEARELINLDLKADLAVLSACETARGRVGRGEGMIGLTWALFVAGVPTTVVSHWKVRSDSTARLMVEFHRGLRAFRTNPSHNGVTSALRKAALKLKADKRYAHPFHWAGFVVVGSGY